MKHIQALFLFFLIAFSAFAQQKAPLVTVPQKEEVVKDEKFLFMEEGDTIAKEAIELNEVVILSELDFDSNIAYRKYLILTRKTRKVYPYAKMAADTLIKIKADFEDITKRRHRKRYIKKMQKFMEEKFTKKLKKFSRTEGQILVKLVNRQTGITMYDLIKDYRSGWSAFWYQKTASLFDISLKRKYDPVNDYQDYLIEDILERSFQQDLLVRQPPAVKFDLFELIDKWKVPPPNPIN